MPTAVKSRTKHPSRARSRTNHKPAPPPGPRAEKDDLVIKCLDCKFKRKTGNFDADRVAARRHATQEGHTVQGIRKSVITWTG
jgi:hypothetical protein